MRRKMRRRGMRRREMKEVDEAQREKRKRGGVTEREEGDFRVSCVLCLHVEFSSPLWFVCSIFSPWLSFLL